MSARIVCCAVQSLSVDEVMRLMAQRSRRQKEKEEEDWSRSGTRRHYKRKLQLTGVRALSRACGSGKGQILYIVHGLYIAIHHSHKITIRTSRQRHLHFFLPKRVSHKHC